jgi:nicotinamidase-related amidase
MENTALMVMDMQAGIISMLDDPELIISNVAKAISVARDHQLQVIYVVVGFRKGAPEISSDNLSFSASKERWTKANPEELTKINPPIAPNDKDIIITKKRISAFTGSDLEVVLRSLGIRHLVLTGFATSGVVLSTLREAADKDYHLTILSDCCGDRDEEVHRVLTTKVFPRQANVITVSEWSNSLK